MSQDKPDFENMEFEAPPTEFEARDPYIDEDPDTLKVPVDDPSEMNVPEMDVPEMDVPEMDVPEMDVPEMDIPDAEVTDVPEKLLKSEGSAFMNDSAPGIPAEQTESVVSVRNAPTEPAKEENFQEKREEEAAGGAPLRVRLDEQADIPEPLPRIFFQSHIEEPPAEGPEEGIISREGVYIPVETVMDQEALDAVEDTDVSAEALVLHEVVLRLAFLMSQYRRIRGMISDLENHTSMLASLEAFAGSIQTQIEILSENGRIDAWKTSVLTLHMPGPGQIQAEDPMSLLAWMAREETWFMRRFLPECMEKVGNAERGQTARSFADVLSACSMRRLVLESFLEGLDKGILYMKKEETVWLCLNCNCLHRGTTPPDACRFCAAPPTSFIEARGFSPYIMDREIFYAGLEPQTDAPDVMKVHVEMKKVPAKDAEKAAPPKGKPS